MAHMIKLTRGALGGMFRHNERDAEDGAVVRSNERIDPTRTHLNYSLTPTPVLQLTPLERVNTLCESEGINIAKRKDLKVAVSWVITAPQSITEDERERFFFECKRFLDTRYGYKGDKNVLCAQIHLDETSPHLHYVFCPVCYDSKNHRHTVSAKNVINRKDLQTFHKDLTEHMRGVFGRDVGIETGITEEQGGNMSVTELKNKTKKNYAESEAVRKGAQSEGERIVSESKAKGREIIGAAEKAVRERLRASESALEKLEEDFHAKETEFDFEIAYLTHEHKELSEDNDYLNFQNEKLAAEIDRAGEQLVKVKNAPPRPKEPPHAPLPYEKWADEYSHSLDNYASGKPFDSKSQREKRRKAAYEAEVAEYEQKIKACAEWDSEWGIVGRAEKVLEREHTLENREKKVSEREQSLDRRIKTEVDKAVKGHRETITYLENRLLEHGIEPYPRQQRGQGRGL